MGQYEWLVMTCRACRRLLKLPPAMAGKSVICPHCRTKISVPKDAPVIEEAAAHSQIPVSRQNDDALPNVRGHESWEVGQRPVGGDLDFKTRLHSTSDADLQPDPDKEMRRVNMRRRRFERDNPDFDDVERRKKRRRKTRSSGAAFGQTFTRVLLVAVIILVGVVGWLAWDRWHQPKPAATKPSKHVQLVTELDSAADGLPQTSTRAFSEYGVPLSAAVRGFTGSKTVDEMLVFVRNRARVESKIRAWYTPQHPWQPIEINNAFKPDEPVAVDADFIVVTLQLPNGDLKPLSLERSGSDFLVDWESFTGYCEMSWDEMKEKRPEQPVIMRVVIERSLTTEYFDGYFADHTKFNCFLLRDEGSFHFLSGYTVKDDSPDIKLQRWLQPVSSSANGLRRCLAIVRVSYPAGSKNERQVKIDELLELGWVFRAGK